MADLDGLVLERFLLLRDEQPPAALAALAASGPPMKRASRVLDRFLRPEDALAYLRETRMLWLSPVLVILLLLGLVLALSGTVLSPLIYKLF